LPFDKSWSKGNFHFNPFQATRRFSLRIAMKTIQLFDALQFHEKNPYSQPLCIDSQGRVLRFALRPGQGIREHNTPDSPLYLIVLDGNGVFSGADEREIECSAGTLLIFDPGEKHTLRARDRDLILIGFMHNVQSK
jgi:quercetin dioxygenase-like cupin family protein